MLQTSFFSNFSSVSVIVVFVIVSFLPFGLNLGSPTIVVFVDVTSRLKVSSSRRCDVPGVDIDDLSSLSSDAFDGDADMSLSIEDFDGEDANRVVEVLVGGDPDRDVVVVVVVVEVTFLSGDRSRFDDDVSELISRRGLRIGTVCSPLKVVANQR